MLPFLVPLDQKGSLVRSQRGPATVIALEGTKGHCSGWPGWEGVPSVKA